MDELVRPLRELEINMESWLSGRKRLTANEVGSKSPQGFESLTLRILELARDTISRAGFLNMYLYIEQS